MLGVNDNSIPASLQSRLDDEKYGPQSAPLTRKDVFWGVFLALWAFGISYAVVAFVAGMALGLIK